MAEHPVAQSYVERSRHDRRIELARLAQERHTDMSVVMGLSWRVNDHQAHVDYAGGIDTGTTPRGLVASLGNLALASVRSGTFLPWRARTGRMGPGSPKVSGSGHVPSLKDALVRAAPVNFQSRHVPGETGDGTDVSADHEHRARDFAAVVARVDTVALAHLARALLEERRRRHPSSPTSALPPADPVPLPRIGKPFFGGGHVFYMVRFPADHESGGVEWIVKIPALSSAGGMCRETLRAEALLLHKLRTETRVPVPEVIDADCNADNEVGCPWLLMEFVRGRRLEDVWFGPDDEGRALKETREVILRNLAHAMFQLSAYEFEKGGALVFDQKDGELVGTGPLRMLDVQAMVERWFVDEDCERTPIYRAAGPWEDESDMYTALLDAYPPGTVAEKGVDELLRLLLFHVREPAAHRRPSPSRTPRGRVGKSDGTKRFVLAHPDLSMRNVIVAEDGTTIKAILGWDGARAAPRSLGNEALPRWLVRDFNPFIYRWQPPADFWRPGHAQPECNRFEDPPWALRELRGFYARVMGELKMAEGKEGEQDIRKQGETIDDVGDGNGDVDVTKQSLLALTLDAAIRDPRCRTASLRRVLEKCSRSFEVLDFDFFVNTLGKGYKIDAVNLRHLANNLRELMDRGFVKGAVVW